MEECFNDMGCTSSSQNSQNHLTSSEGADLLDAFLRLDRDIWREEKAAPASSLGHCMARLEKLNSEIEAAALSMQSDQITMPGTVPETGIIGLESADNAICRALIELRINHNKENANEHEEFIANLTRKALKQHKLYWLIRRKQDTEGEVTRLTGKVQNLQVLYEQQDTLLGKLLQSSVLELEIQLDRVRSYRDTLCSGELTWREATRIIQAGCTLAKAGYESWKSLRNSINFEARFQLATDTRNAIQEAAICIQSAENILPGVQFPYCTAREVTALIQVIEYIYTDLQMPDRYMKALDVYSNFQKRAASLYTWIKQLMEDTIRKDVQDVDQKITELSTQLCNERINLIRLEIRLNNKSAGIGNLNHRLRSDFERKMAARRRNDFSSRKLEDHINHRSAADNNIHWD